jgi:DNA-binding HxlR family transcriptional regulator
LIIRTTYPEIPPKVEYSLSELGKTVKPILEKMNEWGQQYMDFNTKYNVRI